MKNGKKNEIPLYQPHAIPELQELSSTFGFGLQTIFLVFALFFYLLGKSPAWHGLVNNVSINFVAIIVEALPFMLLGTLAGGIIEVFVPVAWVERFFGRKKIRAVFLAGGMGLFFPTCECAIVPVVRRLLGKGVPFAAAITFMLAGPIVNIIVTWSTAIAYTYNWSVVSIRLLCGYVVAVFVGLLLSRFFNRRNGIITGVHLNHSQGCGCTVQEHVTILWHQKARHAPGHAADDFFTVGRYLVIGAFIAALLRSSVPLDAFTGLMGSPIAAIALMMLMAVLLNLCSEADAFISASFRWLLPGSAQMGFMVLGPMFDLKLLLMYFSIFRNRVIIALCATVPTTVFLLMLILEYFGPVFI